MNRRQRIKVALVLSLVASAAVAVEAPSAASAEGVRLRRAAELRQVLLDTIERTIADGRGWPDRLELRGGSRMLVYSKPKIVSKGRVVEDELGASVVLHEPIKAFPGGVWVGYADGHLEFAPDAAALAECMQQVSILHEAIAENPALFEDRPAHPEPRPPIAAPKGSLTVKVVDGDGRAVAGAMVGISSQRGDRFAGQVPIVYFPFVPDEDSTRVTDASGLATIPGPHVFEAARFVDSPTAPMYVLHEGRGLAALEEFTREEFGQEPGKAPERPREVRLRAACRITGELTSLGMRGSGRTDGLLRVLRFAVAERPILLFHLDQIDEHIFHCYCINGYQYAAKRPRALDIDACISRFKLKKAKRCAGDLADVI